MSFLFEDYVLDTERRELRREAALLSMEPQVFDLLAFLIKNRDRVVSRDDLLTSVWGRRIVSESTIASRVNTARRIIGDSGEQQRLICTIIGKGVRFVGKARSGQILILPLARPVCLGSQWSCCPLPISRVIRGWRTSPIELPTT